MVTDTEVIELLTQEVEDLEKELKKARARSAYAGRTAASDENEGGNTDFNRLVEDEIRKGAPPSVAGQRVVNRYGARPDASRILKSQNAAGDFMTQVDALMIEKRLPRTVAMREAHQRHPDLYAAYQEA